MKKSDPRKRDSSELIDARIKKLGDWRGELLSPSRHLIQPAHPEKIQDRK